MTPEEMWLHEDLERTCRDLVGAVRGGASKARLRLLLEAVEASLGSLELQRLHSLDLDVVVGTPIEEVRR